MTGSSHTDASAPASCPRCSSLLGVCPIPDGAMRWCGQCYGLWLDNHACQALVNDRLSDPGRDKLQWVSQQKKPAARTPEGHGYRRPARVDAALATLACPVCSAALSSYVTDSSRHGVRVALDACPAHGTWFDQGEAWVLLQALSLRLAAQGKDPAEEARERTWEEHAAAFGPALCPRCGTPLGICPIPDGAMRWCGQCSGLWLDRRACHALATGGLSEKGRSKIQWVSQQPGKEAMPGGPGHRPPALAGVADGAIRCPVCNGPLSSYVTDSARHGARVTLDVCAAHGTWFDCGEASALLQALSKKVAAVELDSGNGARERDSETPAGELGSFVTGAFAGTLPPQTR